MIKATIDVNSGAVVEWVNVETGVRIDIPRDNWKTVDQWTDAEISELFYKIPLFLSNDNSFDE